MASKLRFPHPLILLVFCILIGAALSYFLTAGEYERREDTATGRTVVVPGTYHAVPRSAVGPFEAIVSIPRGLIDAGSVVFLVFLVGGAFTVVDKTGTLKAGVDWLAARLQRREAYAIPVCCIVFAIGGALENLQEEIIAMVPVLLILTRRLGYDALTAVAISLGAAIVGSAFSPINPFQVQIAQELAQLPLLSGSAFRIISLVIALALWIWGTMRYAAKIRVLQQAEELKTSKLGVREAIILFMVIATFAIFVYGILNWEWDFNHMSAAFFVMGAASGLIGRLGVTGTAEAYVEGFKSMAFAGLLIGFARAIYVVLNDGKIVDTIVHGLFTPISHLPLALSAVGMMFAHVAIHFPVPSVSGQAVLTIPILVPLSDLLGLSRQVTVLAYQFGAGLCEMITPTNGALMAILAAAGVRFEHWLKFVIPLYLLLSALGIIALFIGIAIGL
jgi:uncharacterized ion transporter superfamily protein YfcC